MSKIQKALQILRESRTPAAVAGDGAPRVNDQLHAETLQGLKDIPSEPAPNRSNANIGVPAYRSDAVADERLPEHGIRIALKALIDADLYPNEEDEEQISQQFRRIKRPVINIAFREGVPDNENANVIMVASALPRSGKTYCSINLATSIARERDVGAVLVDADVLKPNISRALGLQDRVGLIDHLLDPTIGIDDIILQTDLHDIVVIPAGQQHEEATELLASRRMGRFVAALSQRFRSRAVIVDTPPLLLTNEAHVLAEHMGQIILIVEAGVSTQESVLQALESLNRTKPVNVILNKARVGFFGEYGVGAYGYYSAPKKGFHHEEKK